MNRPKRSSRNLANKNPAIEDDETCVRRCVDKMIWAVDATALRDETVNEIARIQRGESDKTIEEVLKKKRWAETATKAQKDCPLGSTWDKHDFESDGSDDEPEPPKPEKRGKPAKNSITAPLAKKAKMTPKKKGGARETPQKSRETPQKELEPEPEEKSEEKTEPAPEPMDVDVPKADEKDVNNAGNKPEKDDETSKQQEGSDDIAAKSIESDVVQSEKKIETETADSVSEAQAGTEVNDGKNDTSNVQTCNQGNEDKDNQEISAEKPVFVKPAEREESVQDTVQAKNVVIPVADTALLTSDNVEKVVEPSKTTELNDESEKVEGNSENLEKKVANDEQVEQPILEDTDDLKNSDASLSLEVPAQNNVQPDNKSVENREASSDADKDLHEATVPELSFDIPEAAEADIPNIPGGEEMNIAQIPDDMVDNNMAAYNPEEDLSQNDFPEEEVVFGGEANAVFAEIPEAQIEEDVVPNVPEAAKVANGPADVPERPVDRGIRNYAMNMLNENSSSSEDEEEDLQHLQARGQDELRRFEEIQARGQEELRRIEENQARHRLIREHANVDAVRQALNARVPNHANESVQAVEPRSDSVKKTSEPSNNEIRASNDVKNPENAKSEFEKQSTSGGILASTSEGETSEIANVENASSSVNTVETTEDAQKTENS